MGGRQRQINVYELITRRSVQLRNEPGIIVLVVDHIRQVGIRTAVTLKCVYSLIDEPAGGANTPT